MPKIDTEHNALSIAYHELKDIVFSMRHIAEKGFVEKRSAKLYKVLVEAYKQLDKELPQEIKDFSIDEDW